MSSSSFDLTIFTDVTKNMCMCSAISIFLIITFIVTPFSNFTNTSICMKIIALLLLFYTIYLNYKQTNLLKTASLNQVAQNVKSQLNINIICSYVFTLFLGLLIIFVIKSFL